VRQRLGDAAGRVRFEEGDRFDAMGALDMVVPVLYWRVMPYLA
jgi:hypothetical protein